MIYTTLNKIRKHSPCAAGWKKLLTHLGKTSVDDEPLAMTVILDSNGLDDTLWCLRSVPEHNRLWRLYAVWCARQVQHLMKNRRSLDALDVAERHANGKASDAELSAAWRDACEAAWGATRKDVCGAACGAAREAAWRAAREAAWQAAKGPAWGAMEVAQAQKLREILEATP